MTTRMRADIALSALASFLIFALIAPVASAANGAGSLYVAGATNTPTHWNVVLGSTVAAEIRGVSTAEVGSPLPATLTVYVKSSVWGNTTLTATRIGTSSDYAFTYTPPTRAVDGFDACATTVVAYQSVGLNSNNDYLDDGLKNSTVGAACGFRFVNSNGAPLDCVQVGIEAQPWGAVKQIYR
jgi:hypothetical protein